MPNDGLGAPLILSLTSLSDKLIYDELGAMYSWPGYDRHLRRLRLLLLLLLLMLLLLMHPDMAAAAAAVAVVAAAAADAP